MATDASCLVLAGLFPPKPGGGPERSCAQRYFCLVASTQAAPLGMIYDDFFGLFCKHSPHPGRELYSQGLPLQGYFFKKYLLKAEAPLCAFLSSLT